MAKQKTNNDLSTQVNSLNTKVEVLLEKMTNVDKKTDIIDDKLSKDYATKEWVDLEYGQTKKFVLGLVTLVLTAVGLALIYLVVKK